MAGHSFHTPQPLELEVKVPAGEIVVETVDGEESHVTVEGDEALVADTHVELDGNRLLVEFRGRKNVFGLGITISIGDFSLGGGKLRVHAQIPHGSAATLATASADMHLHGRYREVETKTASGDLVVSGEVERGATVKTVSGDVRVEQVGDRLRVQSVSGDVLARRVGGSIEARSVSGDLRVERVSEGSATFTSVSGDIEVGIEPGSSVDVDANSVSGELSSDVPLSSDPGSAAGGPVVVVRGKTVSGDFRVTRAA
ncbi:MAG: DUF4097 family beta strand repeat-containing protein [Gaiellaceae bacterium]